MIQHYVRQFFCVAATALFIIAAAPFAPAQLPARNMQKEARYWQELEAISKDSVENFKKATEAGDREDLKEALRLYGEVIKKAPNWDVVNRRYGYTLVETGQVEEGMTYLRRALQLKRTPENLIGLAEKMAYPYEKTQGSNADKQEALALAKEANSRNTDKSDGSYPAIVAQLALDLQDEQTFRAATKQLVSQHQNLMPTHYFNAIRAAMDEEWSTAEQEIRTAGQMGLSADIVNQFLDSGIHTRVLAWRYTYAAVGVVLAWAVGLALLFLLGGILSRRTLQYLETADPNELLSPAQHKIRSVYRKVINIAGLYYYLSIPIVIFLILIVTAAIIYAFFVIGTIPVKLVIFLGIGALVTVFQMIKSLFTKIKDEDPGRLLLEREAPGLWALSQEVAGAVGTRPVSEIRVTPGVDVAVYERGSFRERMQDRAERVLIVGAGVLNGFQQNAFRAVLAHEYGHFIHRDTAGGDMAFRVKADMMKFAQAIVSSRQNTRWNLGFHFLRLYYKIFTRISHGASRFQEALADRLAARQYGPESFKEGLSHVVRSKIEFEFLASREINEAVRMKRSLSNLYELPASNGEAEHRPIEEEFQQALSRETSDTDTHPSPSERFRLTSRVNYAGEQTASGMVWELFANKEELTREMSALVEKQVKSAGYSY